MKIGKITVRRSYKPSRIICDIISLAGAAVIVYMTERFINGTQGLTGDRVALSAIFPVLALGVLAVYAVLVLKSHAFKKYKITKKNAQVIYDWYAFSVSLIKLPLLLIIFESMLTFQEISLGIAVNLMNIRLILYIFLIAIIIRMAIHRINTLSHEEKSTDVVHVRAAVVDENEEREKK